MHLHGPEICLLYLNCTADIIVIYSSPSVNPETNSLPLPTKEHWSQAGVAEKKYVS